MMATNRDVSFLGVDCDGDGDWNFKPSNGNAKPTKVILNNQELSHTRFYQ